MKASDLIHEIGFKTGNEVDELANKLVNSTVEDCKDFLTSMQKQLERELESNEKKIGDAIPLVKIKGPNDQGQRPTQSQNHNHQLCVPGLPKPTAPAIPRPKSTSDILLTIRSSDVPISTKSTSDLRVRFNTPEKSSEKEVLISPKSGTSNKSVVTVQPVSSGIPGSIGNLVPNPRGSHRSTARREISESEDFEHGCLCCVTARDVQMSYRTNNCGFLMFCCCFYCDRHCYAHCYHILLIDQCLRRIPEAEASGVTDCCSRHCEPWENIHICCRQCEIKCLSWRCLDPTRWA